MLILVPIVLGFLPFATIAKGEPFRAYLSQVDKFDFPLIRLYVDVLDSSNNPVKGLKQSDFKITEDGKSMNIIDFFDPDSSRQLTTALVLDRSGSMEKQGKINSLKQAATIFVQSSKEMDQIALIPFSSSVDKKALTSDKNFLYNQISSLMPSGGTAYYDAVYDALKMLGPVRGRKAVVALTDGMDNNSWKSLDKTIKLANKYGIPVYTIGLGSRGVGTSGEEGIYETALSQMAEQTGGVYFYAPTGDELARLYELLSIRFQSGYEMSYETPREIKDGTSRKVAVTVSRMNASENATNSYYVPGVIVPTSNLSLFSGLLVPLVILIFVPRLAKKFITPSKEKVQETITKAVDSISNSTVETEPSEDSIYLAPKGTGVISKPFLLKKGVNTIGADPSNDLIIDDPSVAPKHSLIKWERDRYVVYDLISETGTFVSYLGESGKERQVSKHALKIGSTVRFGHVSLSLLKGSDL